MEKRLEEIQGKKQVLEKVLNEKNSKANTLQEEVYVLKERLANAQGTYKREMETEKQKVCVKGFTQSRKCLSPSGFIPERGLGGLPQFGKKCRIRFTLSRLMGRKKRDPRISTLFLYKVVENISDHNTD